MPRVARCAIASERALTYYTQIANSCLRQLQDRLCGGTTRTDDGERDMAYRCVRRTYVHTP